MGRELVGGEIGCYYSHLNAAKAFLRTDKSYCLVIEDDAAPHEALQAIVTETIGFLNAHDPEWRIVNMGNEKLKIFRPLKTMSFGKNIFTLCSAHYFPMTTGAILWSRKGAQEFVDGHRVIFAPVDNFFRYGSPALAAAILSFQGPCPPPMRSAILRIPERYREAVMPAASFMVCANSGGLWWTS